MGNRACRARCVDGQIAALGLSGRKNQAMRLAYAQTLPNGDWDDWTEECGRRKSKQSTDTEI